MVSVFAKARISRGNLQVSGSSSIFLQIKTLVDIEKPSCYAIGLLLLGVLQVKFRFMGSLVKANALVLGNR